MSHRADVNFQQSLALHIERFENTISARILQICAIAIIYNVTSDFIIKHDYLFVLIIIQKQIVSHEKMYPSVTHFVVTQIIDINEIEGFKAKMTNVMTRRMKSSELLSASFHMAPSDAANTRY